jgi:hypothetical protein
MRPDATELGEARRRVEALVSKLPGDRPGERALNEPWEIRAFAIAVAAYHNGQYEWSEFQLSLIESIRQWEQSGRDPDAEPWSRNPRWMRMTGGDHPPRKQVPSLHLPVPVPCWPGRPSRSRCAAGSVPDGRSAPG